MPTKSLLSSIYWCFNYPAGLQTLLCFSAAALSLKFMLPQTAPKVYFCSFVVHENQIWVKLYFLGQFVFLMWWILPFFLLQASFGKTIFLPMQKSPHVRQLPVDFSSLLCANAFVIAQNFSLSMQTFSGQLRLVSTPLVASAHAQELCIAVVLLHELCTCGLVQTRAHLWCESFLCLHTPHLTSYGSAAAESTNCILFWMKWNLSMCSRDAAEMSSSC